MKSYEVSHCAEAEPDWCKLPSFAMDEQLLPAEDGTEAFGRLCWSYEGLKVFLFAKEQNILCRYNGEYDPVWHDSCLEMFFCPIYGDSRYFNIECNPNGATFFGFGTGREDRIRLHPENIRRLFGLETFLLKSGWGVKYTVPATLIRLFFPDFELRSGAKLRANFYKCGEDKSRPHELAWNPITNGKNDFHQSEFFGELYLR